MKFHKFSILLFLILSGFSQELHKEPVAIPAPFELQMNIDLERVVQPLAKVAVTGDTTFFIRKNLRDNQVTLESVEFYLLFENDTIRIYAECTEYDSGRVNDNDIENISNALLSETPANSMDPSCGMLANLNTIFGDFPDVDNNSKLFVLLIDARDDYDPATSDSYVAGYFDPIDQSQSKGNYSDIIYIDTNPAQMTDNHTLGVVAHELQHLIHYHYDPDESTWLNEGFSELAPQLLGYESHSFSRFLSATNKKLTDFDGSLLDYSKVSLWTYYIYKRFGLGAIRQVLRDPSNSMISYESSLQTLGYNITFRRLLRDWFLANLLNDPTIEEGIYSYSGAYIPLIESEFYHSNFTNGEIIHGTVQPQAAQYIQFDGGRNIYLSLDFQIHSLAELTVIKHKNPSEIEIININNGKFDFEDLSFGEDYKRLSLVLDWTASVSNTQFLEFSYSAVGIGGFEEIEYKNDSDTLDYYIALNSNYLAAEKFYSEEASEITSIKFNCGTSNPVDIKIYTDLARNPFLSFDDIPSNSQGWTIYNLQNPIPISEQGTYFIALTSANSSGITVGYSDNGTGKNWAFLNTGSGYADLDNFSVDENHVLTGNWKIRSVNRCEIFQAPELVLEPDTLFFFSDDTAEKTFSISNLGTEVMHWSVKKYSHLLTLSDTVGLLSSGTKNISVTPDFESLYAGLYESDIIIETDNNRDSVHIVQIKKNVFTAQTAFLLPTDIFDQNLIKMKVFNIGLGIGEFNIKEYPSYLAVNPENGFILPEDTLVVDLMIDSSLVAAKSFGFVFENGVGEIYRSLKYNRTMEIIESENLKIYAPAPNPFIPQVHGKTNILVNIKNNQKAVVKIFNLKGEKVYFTTIENSGKGLHLVIWNGLTEAGSPAHSGLYFVQVEQGGARAVTKMVVIR
ncbi:MAG: T9SS type A sorting domain-containing protein [Candidatus Marinimicrobia bacterium]|nr:T9SS type A sorting domain-containing protein [Candidatus Neomarinimicrobiota bacterium]